jgi:DNA polymerase
MTIYSIDFETRSTIDLVDQGLDIYANDPSTEVLCTAYGTTTDNVEVVSPYQFTHNTKALINHVRNGGKIQAWNAMFEYAIWNCVCVPKYGWPPLKLEQVIDSMAIAAANNIPQNLDDAGTFMDSEHKKDTRGRYLIQKLCKPNRKGVFEEDPTLMAELFEYCKKDVQTEMAVTRQLRNLTAPEQAVWELTQRINLRGVPVDPKELQNAVKAVQSAQNKLDEETLQLTGCKPSERAKLLAWLNGRGANMDDLTAKGVSAKLVSTNLHSDVRRALELRQEGSQTSVAKYAKMEEIHRGGFIRNTLVYHGASTGRFASKGGVNLQNLARPSISDSDIEKAIPRVFGEGIGTMAELSSLVRSAIVAPTGKMFVISDYSSVENRVGVWLAGQTDKVEMFRQGLDEYKTFASENLYRVNYDEVTKDQRQVSKSAVLGCLFGQGAKGLVKYAEGMGVKLTEVEAKNAVDNYRMSYSRVKNLWAACEKAAMDAVENPGTAFSAGPKLKLKVVRETLWMQLPSGRLICWQRPQIELFPTTWGTEKKGVGVHSQNTLTRQWARNQIIGSSIFQSAVQATARDLLVDAVKQFDLLGFETINLVHDEVILLEDEDNAESVFGTVKKIMSTPPEWASDLPLACEGTISKRYCK